MAIGLSGVQFSLYSRGSLFQLIFCGLKGGPLFGGGQLLEHGHLFEEIWYATFLK